MYPSIVGAQHYDVVVEVDTKLLPECRQVPAMRRQGFVEEGFGSAGDVPDDPGDGVVAGQLQAHLLGRRQVQDEACARNVPVRVAVERQEVGPRVRRSLLDLLEAGQEAWCPPSAGQMLSL